MNHRCTAIQRIVANEEDAIFWDKIVSITFRDISVYLALGRDKGIFYLVMTYKHARYDYFCPKRRKNEKSKKLSVTDCRRHSRQRSIVIKANSTWCSQAVTHLSTNQAQRCLTSLIGREAVHSTWYGRWQK